MVRTEEVEARIVSEVAKCKAADPDTISTEEPIVEGIGLHGDDFMQIAAYLHRKYNVRPAKGAYKAGMTIKQWAETISAAANCRS